MQVHLTCGDSIAQRVRDVLLLAWGRPLLASVVLPRPASRALHSAPLRSTPLRCVPRRLAPMALRATRDRAAPVRERSERAAGGGGGHEAERSGGFSGAWRWRTRQRLCARRASSAGFGRWWCVWRPVGPRLRQCCRGTPHKPAPTHTSNPPPAAAAKPPPAPGPPVSWRTGGAESRRPVRRVLMLRRPRRTGPCL